MKTIHWTTLCMVAFLGAGALAYSFFPDSPAPSTLAAKANPGAEASIAHAKDGAADYRTNLALAAAKTDEHNPLRSYVPTPGVAGRLALEKIYAKGLPATPQSAALALDLLRSGRLSPDEKIPISGILYSLYNRENTTGANNDIALELKILAADPDKQIAHDATMHYAGLEYLPGTELVLKQALERGALDTDSYFRELAHLVTSAPLEKQKEFLAEIRASSNQLASHILADALNSGKDFNAAPFLKSSEDMAELLRTTEPAFSKGAGLYGETDAIRYTTWIRASAALEGQKTGRNMDDIIIAKLSEPGTDPRKIMGYLSSPEAMPLLGSAAPDSPVRQLAVIADQYASQHPGNRYMGEVVQEIRSRMKNPPPALPRPVFTLPAGPVPGPQPIPSVPQATPGRHP